MGSRTLLPRFDASILPRLGLLVPVVVILSPTMADPDLWGHLRFGLDVLRSGIVGPPDPYSFASDVPWVNHEWLSELAFGTAYAAAGSTGLIVLRFALLSVTFLLVAAALGRSGLPPLGRDILLACVMAGTHPIAQTVRPQLFSLAAFAWLLSCLSAYERRGVRALWPVPLLMIPWANLHGGMLVGVGSLGVWTAATLTASLWTPAADPNSRRRHQAVLAAVGLAALAATLVNPYGIGLWRFLSDTVSLSRADISEWQPLSTLPPARIGLWIVAFGLAATAAVTRQIRMGPLGIVVLLAYASMRVRRLDGFFILAVVMLCAPAVMTVLARVKRDVQPYPAPPRIRPALAAAVTVAALAAIGIGGAVRPAGRFGCIDITDVRLADPAAGRALKAAGLEGRMLTWFDWGEYAIWHLSPGVRVSMDGRRETVYSDAILQAHLAFYGGRDDLALVERLQPDVIWLPARFAVVRQLEQTGWQRAFDGDRSVVLSRAPIELARPLTNIELSSKCFPGP